jgi:hypothetical protein
MKRRDRARICHGITKYCHITYRGVAQTVEPKGPKDQGHFFAINRLPSKHVPVLDDAETAFEASHAG